MKPKQLKPSDCVTKGTAKRSDAIHDLNKWTRATSEQHDIIKIDGMWYVYNRVTHH